VTKKGVAVDDIMRAHQIRPSAHRMAIAEYVLFTDEHPNADTVWKIVLGNFPTISRATVYNTLNLFVEKGLLKQVPLVMKDGSAVYESNTKHHHYFIDEETGRVYDVDFKDVRVQAQDLRNLPRFDVREYMIVMRGRARRNP
jgi:Fe2+ or Zn2+ uptake regulation protein